MAGAAVSRTCASFSGEFLFSLTTGLTPLDFFGRDAVLAFLAGFSAGTSASVRMILMWAVRLLMREPEPRARACMRLRVGPSPATACLMTRPSTRRLLLCSALAMADARVL